MTSRLAPGTAPTMTRFEQFKYEFGLAVGITVISAVLLYLVGRRKLADCFKRWLASGDVFSYSKD